MNRWQLTQQLFEETLELEAGERSRVLRERANGDAQLVQGVEGLLAAASRPWEALDGTAANLLAALRDEPPAETLCGQTCGPYRIDAHLSSGGMAHVYRATRHSAGTERRVALKVLRHGLDGAAFLERFQRERETLARLEHEHIVAFLDADALPDGRPYLVMELVEGVPLTHWSATVPLRTRLELFVRVVAAVQYAHQQLVVHRDLKPSNVLVTALGAPKVLDFGVATVLGDAGEHGPLTPKYASPEQLRGEAVTAASDVYSLGVLLCEIVSSKGDPGLQLDGLGGDLGAIARKALAPDPAARYGSAAELGDDLRRFLAHEPIAARPGTWAYRARLFARRNRWPLALLVASIVLPIAGWIGADIARRRAVKESSIGWGAHAQARAVQRLLEDALVGAAASDPALAASASEHLENELRGRLAAAPEAEFLVRVALARLYLDRGDLERAAPHAQRAVELSRDTRGIGAADGKRAEELAREIRARAPAR